MEPYSVCCRNMRPSTSLRYACPEPFDELRTGFVEGLRTNGNGTLFRVLSKYTSFDFASLRLS